MECNPQKIIAIVHSDITDKVRPLRSINEDSKMISKHIIKFFEGEVFKYRAARRPWAKIMK